jgi:hypothetical protein
MFHQEAVLTEKEEEKEKEEMQSFMLDEKKIAEVIRSRDDLSANRIDGISHRVIKAAGAGAGAEGVKFVRILLRGILESGRVMSS